MPWSLPAALRGRFDVVRVPGTVAVVRSDFRPAFDALGLLAAAREAGDDGGEGPGPGCEVEAVRAAGPPGGRGAAFLLPAGALGEVVVRPFRRGGWLRRVNRRRYLRGDRALDELALTERLRLAGAPVPEVLAAVQTRIGPGPAYAAALVSRRAAGFSPAALVLRGARPGRAAARLEQIGRAVRRVHEAGGRHADLNAWNVLVPTGRAGLGPLVIDWDRGRFVAGGVRGAAAEANLARLERSLRRLGLAAAVSSLPALRAGYEAAPGPVPAA
ncbi:MAG: lipopolysaccharide kinase InaA family protein [Gemmatimonadota bacterium]|nr:lipopolysaccharide kinase InaA family protein [Gemmatimonadota bacterium]